MSTTNGRKVLALVWLPLVTLLLNLAGADASIYFYLPQGQSQCFGYEASRQSHEPAISVDVFYSATNCPSCRISAVVQGPSMQKITSETLRATGEYNSFTFQANIGGVYRVCLTLLASVSERLQMEMEIVGANDKREHQRLADGTVVRPAVVSKDGYVEQHAKVSALVKRCSEEASRLSARQTEFDATVYSTHWRVIVFTLLNAVIVLGVGAWQIVHLRSFFKEKKLV